ncbi:hypothetical protein GCM10010401_12770 [Rarobacter faecitabidus]
MGKTQLVNAAVALLDGESRSTAAWFIDEADTNLASFLAIDGSPDSPARLADAILESFGDNPPAVLRIEDAQLLDDVSSRAVVRLMQQRSVTVIVTMRATSARHQPWVAAWKNLSAARVDVRPFDRAETEAFLTAVLRGPVTSDTVWRVWRLTGGNPFHIAQLVNEQATARGFLEIEGVWLWDGQPSPDARLYDIAGDDLSRLAADSRTALELLALVGPLPDHLLRDLTDEAQIRDLDRRGLLSIQKRTTVNGSFEVLTGVMHDLYGQAVRSRISSRRRAELLDLIESHAPNRAHYRPFMSQYASLVLECGRPMAPEIAIAAVRALILEHKPRTAIRVATDAVIEGATIADDLELLLLRADAHRTIDDPDGAARALGEVEQLLALLPAADVAEHARHILTHARALAALEQFHFDRHPRAHEILQRHWDRLADHLDPQSTAVWDRAFTIVNLTHRAYAGEHAAVCAESLDLLLEPTAQHQDLLISLAAPTALGLAELGRVGDALELSRRYIAAAYAHLDSHAWGPAELIAAHSLILLWAGDLEPLIQPHPTIHTDRDPAQVDRVMDHIGRASIAMAQGSWSAAAVEFHAANARFALVDTPGMASFTLYGEALALAASGRSAQAWAVLEKARGSNRRIMNVIGTHLDLSELDTLIWLRDAGAVPLARRLADEFRAAGYGRAEMEALHRYVTRTLAGRSGGPGKQPDLADVTRAVERMEELVQHVDSKRASLLAQHARAVLDGDSDLAVVRERDLNYAGLWLAPAREAADLTRREREIATLACGGMSSKAIAQRLTVSVRTVDSHLSRVFAKTGVHSREELTRVLR